MYRIFIAALMIAACAGNPGARECATGITCPAGTQCAAAQPVCITNACGDGVVQSTEKCDDGNIVDGDGCSANCLSREICGDGVLNSAAGEVCDDNNTLGGDGCSGDCKSIEICGNMVRDVGEACDDGNTVSGDGCSGNCRSTEVCGNGIVDINEKCDDMSAPGGCNDDCQGGTGCGDGAIDRDGQGNPLEECDDGNTDNQDDCTNLCKLSKCGDGILQTSGVHIEGCDPAIGFGETLGCNIDCTSATCGDGKINRTRGEQCDDQNAVDADACKNDCTVNYCGDGVPGGPNEACDTGGNSATCDANCTSPTCGDGFINPQNGEECDSSGVNTSTCDANCTIPKCGDGTKNTAAGEDCDDMNSVNGDDCRNDCKLNVCGDGYTDAQAPATEACDDGNTTDESSCPYGVAVCQMCNHNCNAIENLTGNVCGDSVIGGPEACDDGNRVTETQCPYGSATCTICTASCLATQSLSNGSYCGDGTTDAPMENCDDHNTNACGTCDANCNQLASAQATGYILAVAGTSLNDGQTFTISDGATTVVFELDDNNTLTDNAHKAVDFNSGTAATTVADRIKSAINGTALKITASSSGNLVTLVHNVATSLGNQTITENVSNQDFVVSGMSGGAGGNCAAGIGCKTDADCASGVCSMNLCQ